MFAVELTSEAEKDLESFEQKTAESIIKKLNAIRTNPLHYIERLSGISLRKLRVGDYRAIMQVSTREKKLVVIKIGHRSKIYDRI